MRFIRRFRAWFGKRPKLDGDFGKLRGGVLGGVLAIHILYRKNTTFQDLSFEKFLAYDGLQVTCLRASTSHVV